MLITLRRRRSGQRQAAAAHRFRQRHFYRAVIRRARADRRACGQRTLERALASWPRSGSAGCSFDLVAGFVTAGGDAQGMEPPLPIHHDPSILTQHRRVYLTSERPGSAHHQRIAFVQAYVGGDPLQGRQAYELNVRVARRGERRLDCEGRLPEVGSAVGGKRLRAARMLAARDRRASQADPIARTQVSIRDDGEFAQVFDRRQFLRAKRRRAGAGRRVVQHRSRQHTHENHGSKRHGNQRARLTHGSILRRRQRVTSEH